MAGARSILPCLLALAIGACVSCGPGESGSPAPAEADQAGSAPAAQAPSPVDPALLAHPWRLRALGEIGEEDSVPSDPAITLRFAADHRVEGSGGCNRYSTLAHYGPERAIGLGALATTRMACDPETMEREEAFFRALGSVASYEVGDDQLLLFYDDANKAMLFGVATEDDPH